MYEPSFTAETAADEVDRKFLTPRACKRCGVMMDNGFDDECNDCWQRRNGEDDDETSAEP